MVGKIYAEILVDIVRNQIFTLKQISEKGQEKKCRMQLGFMDLEKTYDRVNR